MKKFLSIIIGGVLLMGLTTACFEHDSDVVSKNLSTEADQFHIARRVVFYNGITGDYMLEIIGYCALGNSDSAGELTVVCKTAGAQTETDTDDAYKKHFLGLSDNVTYFVEQVEPAVVSSDQYKVIFKPSTIVPDFDAN